jgi:hypothetical protein
VSVLTKLCASLSASPPHAGMAGELGARWAAALVDAARRDFGVVAHPVSVSRSASLSPDHRALLLSAWAAFLGGPSSIIDRAPPAASAAAAAAAAAAVRGGGEPDASGPPPPPPPFSQEWLLSCLLPLLTPSEAAGGNYVRLVVEPKGVSPPSVVAALVRAWPAAGPAPGSPLPHVLTALPCVRALLDSLPGVDGGVAEECVRAVFELVRRAAQAALAAVGGSRGTVARGALAQGVEVLVDCLGRCRSNAVALPFLDSVDALELVMLLCDCVAADAVAHPDLLPLLRDLLSNVSR